MAVILRFAGVVSLRLQQINSPMTKYFLLLLLLIIPQPGFAQDECVVLLHGLARVSNSMGELENKLQRAGYSVANVSYPSRRHGISTLAEDAVSRGLERCGTRSPEKIHFVTHSLGGILVRAYLDEHSLLGLGHVVMLGPPNQGSELVDCLILIPGFRFVIGPAGVELGAVKGTIVPKLGPVGFDLGIIAGTTSIFPLFSLFIPGPDDTIVSVESTRVEGMNQHLVLPVTHSLMMRNNVLIDHVIHYLKTGGFIPV